MTTEPAGKIITIRVTSNDPDLPMEDFRLLCRDALKEVSTSTAVMSEHFNVEGQHVPAYAWGKEEPEPKKKKGKLVQTNQGPVFASTDVEDQENDLATVPNELANMPSDQIHARLNAADDMVTEMEGHERLTQGYITQLSRDFFLLKTFARGTDVPAFKDRAETLCARITDLVGDHANPAKKG